MTAKSLLRIATRNSPLAMWQAKYVEKLLSQAHPELEVEIVGMTTLGDQLLDRSLAKVGGKGLFLKELEVSLLNHETDIAVHSMKDVPVHLPDGLEIPVVCEREDARDAFVSNDYQNLYALPPGSRVGTSSLRRTSQLKSAFPELEFHELRGNVNTRLAKLDDGQYDAIILAAAGLIRLGFADRIKQRITPELCLPAVGQGIVGIECRSDDEDTKALLQPLHSLESAIYLAAERAMNATLDGGCQVPVAGFAEVAKGNIRMRGMVGMVNGSKTLTSNMTSSSLSLESAQRLGRDVGEDLLRQGAGEILSTITRVPESVDQPAKPVVLLTRQRSYLGNMESILSNLEYEPVVVQTLAVEARVDKEIDVVLENLDRYSDLIFVSRNAVEFAMAWLQHNKASIPEHIKVMAVGAETAKHLYTYGIEALFPDQGTGVEALLAVKNLKDLSGRKILIVRGTYGLKWPAEEMRQRGADVDHVDIYTQKMPDNGVQAMTQLFRDHDQVTAVFLHSAQSATYFMQLAADKMAGFADAFLVVGSERIAETARSLGWENEIRVAKSPTNKHMMKAFSGYLGAKIS